MTIATDLGFKIGELYRVVESVSSFYTINEVVRFIDDDYTNCPWFQYVSGPSGVDYCMESDQVAIELENLVPIEPTKSSINKSLLVLYIQQQYPDAKVLKALVESL